MELYDIFASIEATGLATWVRDSIYWLPLINAAHVVAIALVFGTIFIVDLRLLGVASTNRAFSRVAGDLLKWTWIGFAVAAVTGILMFSANATTFYTNTQFQLKMVAIVLAGINMIVFEFLTIRRIEEWDEKGSTPPSAKVAGVLSIGLWASVVVLGRWIGYTKGFNFSAPPPDDLDLDNLFQSFVVLPVHVFQGLPVA